MSNISGEYPMRMKFLEVNNVTKTYRADVLRKKMVALNNLSVTFPLQKCTGLFGHNGAGKTTLIRLIFGISNPSKGKITIDGSDINDLDKTKIGYMPEVDKTANVLTPCEILRNHCAIFRIKNAKEKITETLTKVGLLASKNKKSAALSKGMGRRLAFAQAIIHEPQFLVLDEPFSGLDPLGRADMHTWITEQKDRNTTIILCSHELKEAYSLCDEYNILRKGNLVYSTVTTPDITVDDIKKLVFEIIVAGVNADTLEQMQSKYNLPMWVSSEQQEELTKVCFTEYSQAAQWMANLATSDYHIVSFTTNNEQKPHDGLLKFFDLGEQVA